MSTPRPVKKLFRNAGVRGLLCWTGASYIRFVWATGRWTVVNGEISERYLRDGKACIICFWHGRLLMLPCAWDSRYPFHMLISQHPDGKLIAETVKRFGIETITGSSSRGGSQALRQMMRVLDDGGYVGVTPDGPQGPRMRANAGAVNLSRLTGAPILPVAFSSVHGRRIDSWDRFLIPRPFSRGALVWGEPLQIAKDLDDDGIERARRQLEARLIAVTDQADRLCGREPVEPAPMVLETGS